MNRNLEYDRARTRDTGLLLVVLTSVTTGLVLTMVVLNFLQLGLMQDAAVGQYLGLDLASRAARIQGYQTLSSFLFFVVLVASVVVFLLWVYRSNTLARALGASAMEHTPGWSVGWFFVPVANLFMPYFVMKEIYLATCSPRNYSMAHDEPPGLKTVRVWWLLALADRLFAVVTTVYTIRLVSTGQYATAGTMSILSACLSLMAGLMTVALVLEFRHQQELAPVGELPPAHVIS
jgi:hypothetical protein